MRCKMKVRPQHRTAAVKCNASGMITQVFRSIAPCGERRAKGEGSCCCCVFGSVAEMACRCGARTPCLLQAPFRGGHDLTLPSSRSRSSISCCILSCRDSLCRDHQRAVLGYLSESGARIYPEYWWTPALPFRDVLAWLGAHDQQRSVRSEGHY